MNEERSSPGSKKKFLYLDKFNDHVTKDIEWKKKIEKIIPGMHKLLLGITLISLLALILAIVK